MGGIIYVCIYILYVNVVDLNMYGAVSYSWIILEICLLKTMFRMAKCKQTCGSIMAYMYTYLNPLGKTNVHCIYIYFF